MRNLRFEHRHTLIFGRLLILLTLGRPWAINAAATNALIAYYRLQTNGADCLSNSPNFVVSNARLAHDVLYIDGTYFAPAPPTVGQHPDYRGTPLLRAFNYQSFTVGLDFYPLSEHLPKPKQSLNKVEKVLDDLTRGCYREWFTRSGSSKRNILTGGRSYRWLGFNRVDNQLNLTLNNQRFTHPFKGSAVKPNRWHHVLCSVNLGERRILTWLDGEELETIILPQDFKLEIVGSPDEATDQEFTFVNFSNGEVLNGYATELKVFGRALAKPELTAEATTAFANLPAFPGSSFPWAAILLILAIVGLAVLVLIRLRIMGKKSQCDSDSTVL